MRASQHRLNSYEQRLRHAYRILAADVVQRQAVLPAAEWLLDNFPDRSGPDPGSPRGSTQYAITASFPRSYMDAWSGLPRVYALTTELLERTDSRVDAETMVRYILAYQSVTAAFDGRTLGSSDHVAFRADRAPQPAHGSVLLTRHQRLEGTRWGERIRAAFSSPAQLSATIAELRVAYPRPAGAFALQLLYQIGDGDQETNIRRHSDWLTETIVEGWGSIEGLTHAEHRRQAADQATVGSIITQHAHAVVGRLDRLVRACQHGRADPAARSG